MLHIDVVHSRPRSDFVCHGRDLNACTENSDGSGTFTCEYTFTLSAKLSANIVTERREFTVTYPLQKELSRGNDYWTLFYNECGFTGDYTLENCRSGRRVDVSRSDPRIVGVDGVERKVSTLNGDVPGPTMCVGLNDTVVVTVVNEMDGIGESDTSLHFHGQFQRGTPWMDGVGYVSQCPVTQGQSFTHEFTASPGGTFWAHSHVALQLMDGVYASLIVFDPEELRVTEGHYPQPTEENPEYIAIFGDWFHESAEQRNLRGLTRYIEPDGSEFTNPRAVDGSIVSGAPFVSALINGWGGYYPENEMFMEPFTFFVKPSTAVRFRFICASGDTPFRISIDNHRMLLIAMDGYDINTPLVMDAVLMWPGERYDVLVHTNQTAASDGNYAIRFETLRDPQRPPRCGQSGEPPCDPTTFAILSYTERPLRFMDEFDTPSFPKTTSILENCSPHNPCTIFNCPWPEYYAQRDTGRNSGLNCVSPGELESHPNDFNKDILPPDPTEPDAEVILLNWNILGNRNQQRPNVNGVYLTLPPNQIETDPNWFSLPTACLQDPGNFEECTYFENLDFGKTYTFIMTNRWPEAETGPLNFPGYQNHPIHMHGHSFYVLAEDVGTLGPFGDTEMANGCANGIGDPEWYCYDQDTRDGNLSCTQSWGNCTFFGDPTKLPPLKDPRKAPRRDTIVVPTHGYTIISIRADNPGWWIFHCHVAAHLASGMGLLLNEANPENFELQNKDLPAFFPQCGSMENLNRIDFEELKLRANANPLNLVELQPSFRSRVFNYRANVTCDVKFVEIIFEIGTVDEDFGTNGADILVNGIIGSDGQPRVALLEGETTGIKIEVAVEGFDAEGSGTIYQLQVFRQLCPPDHTHEPTTKPPEPPRLCTIPPENSGSLYEWTCRPESDCENGCQVDGSCSLKCSQSCHSTNQKICETTVTCEDGQWHGLPENFCEDTCEDTPTWYSKYGDCSTYYAGEKNHKYCASDNGVGLDKRIATVSCPVACGTCGENAYVQNIPLGCHCTGEKNILGEGNYCGFWSGDAKYCYCTPQCQDATPAKMIPGGSICIYCDQYEGYERM